MAKEETYSIVQYDHTSHSQLVPQLLDLHISCILIDNMIARFLPPFTDERRLRMKDFYQQQIDAVNAGSQLLFLCVEANSSNDTDGEQTLSSSRAEKVLGMVFLVKPPVETGPFRANVGLLMVSPDQRRRGIATRLMLRLEDAARACKRTCLTLDTEEGCDAHRFLYPRLGYTELGRLPEFGYSPRDHSLMTAVFFYKHLEKPPAEPFQPL